MTVWRSGKLLLLQDDTVDKNLSALLPGTNLISFRVLPSVPSLHHQKLTDLYESCGRDISCRTHSSLFVPSSCLHYLLQVLFSPSSLNCAPPLCIMTSSFFTLYFLSHYPRYTFLSSHKLTILRWQFLCSPSFLPLPPKSPLLCLLSRPALVLT